MKGFVCMNIQERYNVRFCHQAYEVCQAAARLPENSRLTPSAISVSVTHVLQVVAFHQESFYIGQFG